MASLAPILLSVDSVMLILGIIFLYVGAELLVGSASALALGWGVKAATVGVTIIAFATTAPELFVSTIGSLNASDGIALGNIIGSNIANIGLVLGVSALLRPMDVDRSILRKHGPFMVAAAVALVGLGLDGNLSILDGTILILILGAFTAFLLYQSRLGNDDVLPDELAVEDEDVDASWRDGLTLLLAGVILLLGARALIFGGRGILVAFGYSDLFIGLTIIAFGTSVPELATSVVSALRGESDFSIGNVVGSNIYNVLAVIGLVALIVPIRVSPSTIGFEFPVMLGFTFGALGLMWYNDHISRVEGGVLLGGYFAFIYFLLP